MDGDRCAAGARPRARGSSRSCAQAIESRISSLRVALGVASLEQLGAVSSASPRVQELASMTTGSSPPSLQRHSASTVWLAIAPWPCRVALRASTGSRSSGRRRRPGSTAAARPAPRPRPAPRAGSAPAAAAARAAEDPVDAGGQVDGGGALARAVAGSSAGAGVRHRRRPLRHQLAAERRAAPPGLAPRIGARADRRRRPAGRRARRARPSPSGRPARSATRSARGAAGAPRAGA